VDSSEFSDDIAIIGMAGRFPGARNITEFWNNLRNGIESISFFTDQELLDSGVDIALINDPDYVRARGVLDGIELFDASFFGLSPREAEITDPQHRLFLECAWEALDNAGYTSDSYVRPIGVFAGAAVNAYLLANVLRRLDLVEALGTYQTIIANEKDYLATRTSYKLNLNGPSLTVQTACSTSLVAVHLACQSLLNEECDTALAGGVSITTPQKIGRIYNEGGISSPDGHCRAFDAKARGTIGGSGLGIVVLKRLACALADGDHIRAIIKGSAVNNDGAFKVGYTAPSVEGQAKVISLAQAVSGVHPETISYVEGHGTGTSLGDPIEVAALTEAFRALTDKKQFCALGSVKTNIGHLDAAAGVAGLIKTVLSLENRQIPATLHFNEANPGIDFPNSPFYVNRKLSEWTTNGGPRRAGVSSFGIGGTNAHVIVEEAPVLEETAAARDWEMLVLSARSEGELQRARQELADHLKRNETLNLSDVAHTLQVGRRRFPHRMAVACRSVGDAITALEGGGAGVFAGRGARKKVEVVFVFSGQGGQYAGMCGEMYEQDRGFREDMDRCIQRIKEEIGEDLREVLYECSGKEAQERLKETRLTQPAVFVTSYSLARYWMRQGVTPAAMIGHSVGEYVAACLAGVMTESEALRLVARRGELMQKAERGRMLAVRVGGEEAEAMVREGVWLAAVNGTRQSVMSGREEAIQRIEEELRETGTEVRRLEVSHAYHSGMMAEVAEEFDKEVRQIDLKPPQMRYISTVSGRWVTGEEVRQSEYWRRQIIQRVRFKEAINEAEKEMEPVMLEVSAGSVLSGVMREDVGEKERVVTSLRGREGEMRQMTEAMCKVWLGGGDIEWSKCRAGQKRRRVELPSYPMERERFWVEAIGGNVEEKKKPRVGQWLYEKVWKQARLRGNRTGRGIGPGEEGVWLVTGGEERGYAEEVRRLAEAKGRKVEAGRKDRGIREAMDEIIGRGEKVSRVIDMRLVGERADEEREAEAAEEAFMRFLKLVQEVGDQRLRVGEVEPMEIVVISSGMEEVTGKEEMEVWKAAVKGAVKVAGQEYEGIRGRVIDIEEGEGRGGWERERMMKELVEEIARGEQAQVAYRGKQRWVETYEKVREEEKEGEEEGEARIKEGGVYLITGGLGGIAAEVARYIGREKRGKVVMMSRSIGGGEVGKEEKRKRVIEELRGEGVELEVVDADVGEEEEVRRAVEEAEKTVGAITGVFHLAGPPRPRITCGIRDTTRDHCRENFQSKVSGIKALGKVFEHRTLDFCISFSSLAAILGGLGYAAYSSANCYMDAFSRNENRKSPTWWASIDWDAWRLGPPVETRRASKASLIESALSPDEGIGAVMRILRLEPLSQIIVSKADLQPRIDQWIKLEFLRQPEKRLEDHIVLHQRPALESIYVAPTNEVEARIAKIWQLLLGINEIGINDSLFDLGGDSLLAIQVISRIREEFGIDLPLRLVFDSPTVAELAISVVHKKAEEADDQMLARLLEEVEQLSEDEARNALAVDARQAIRDQPVIEEEMDGRPC
jgi:acyl transferase domain-containing protein/acyl carrier protein